MQRGRGAHRANRGGRRANAADAGAAHNQNPDRGNPARGRGRGGAGPRGHRAGRGRQRHNGDARPEVEQPEEKILRKCLHTSFALDEDSKDYLNSRLPHIRVLSGSVVHTHPVTAICRRAMEGDLFFGRFGRSLLEADARAARFNHPRCPFGVVFGDARRYERDDPYFTMWTFIPDSLDELYAANKLRDFMEYQPVKRRLEYCSCTPSECEHVDCSCYIFYSVGPQAMAECATLLEMGKRVIWLYWQAPCVSDCETPDGLRELSIVWDASGTGGGATLMSDESFHVRGYARHFAPFDYAGKKYVLKTLGAWGPWRAGELWLAAAPLIAKPLGDIRLEYNDIPVLCLPILGWIQLPFASLFRKREIWMKRKSYNKLRTITSGKSRKQIPNLLGCIGRVLNDQHDTCDPNEALLALFQQQNRKDVTLHGFTLSDWWHEIATDAERNRIRFRIVLGALLGVVGATYCSFKYMLRREKAQVASLPLWLGCVGLAAAVFAWLKRPRPSQIEFEGARLPSVSVCLGPWGTAKIAEDAWVTPPAYARCVETFGVQQVGPSAVLTDGNLEVWAFRNCVHNEVQALQGRVLMRVPAPVMSHQVVKDHVLRRLCDTSMVTGRALHRPTDEEYAQHFRGQRRDLLLGPNVAVQRASPRDSTKAFVKIEKYVTFVGDVQLAIDRGDYHKDPRLVQGRQLEYQLALGPMGQALSKHYSLVYRRIRREEPLRGQVFVVSGWTAEEIGEWYAESLQLENGEWSALVAGDDVVVVYKTIFGTLRAICADGKRMDAHMGEDAQAMKLEIYSATVNLTSEEHRLIASDGETHGRTMNGVRYGCLGGNKSGTWDTSASNSLYGAATVEIAMTVWDGIGSPAVLIEQKALQLGLEYEAFDVAPERAEFCSGLFWPVGNTIIFGPKPGRQLPKIFFVTRAELATTSHLRGVALGVTQHWNHVPLLGDMVRRVLTLTSGVVSRPVPMEEYRVKTREQYAPTDETYWFFCQRYGVSMDDIYNHQLAIAGMNRLESIKSPLLDQVIITDNSDPLVCDLLTPLINFCMLARDWIVLVAWPQLRSGYFDYIDGIQPYFARIQRDGTKYWPSPGHISVSFYMRALGARHQGLHTWAQKRIAEAGKDPIILSSIMDHTFAFKVMNAQRVFNAAVISPLLEEYFCIRWGLRARLLFACFEAGCYISTGSNPFGRLLLIGLHMVFQALGETFGLPVSLLVHAAYNAFVVLNVECPATPGSTTQGGR